MTLFIIYSIAYTLQIGVDTTYNIEIICQFLITNPNININQINYLRVGQSKSNQ